MPNNIGEIPANGVEIDTKKAENILAWLIQREAANVRTKARTDVQVISDIQKRIKEETECY